eukprot:tig00000571_g2191.t1
MSRRARSIAGPAYASASLLFGAPVSLEVAVAHIRAATRAAAAAAAADGDASTSEMDNVNGRSASFAQAHEDARDAAGARKASRVSSEDSIDASDAGEGAGGWLALNIDEAEAVIAAAAAAAAVPASLGPLTLWEVRPRGHAYG